MTREEAIAIIRKEYLCVDRDCDIERSCGKCDLMMPNKEPILEAYKMAIKALEQEPCEVSQGLVKNSQGFSQEPCEDVISSQQKDEEVAKAFQLGVAFGFGKRYDEMDKIIEEIKKVITPQKKSEG